VLEQSKEEEGKKATNFVKASVPHYKRGVVRKRLNLPTNKCPNDLKRESMIKVAEIQGINSGNPYLLDLKPLP